MQCCFFFYCVLLPESFRLAEVGRSFRCVSDNNNWPVDVRAICIEIGRFEWAPGRVGEFFTPLRKGNEVLKSVDQKLTWKILIRKIQWQIFYASMPGAAVRSPMNSFSNYLSSSFLIGLLERGLNLIRMLSLHVICYVGVTLASRFCGIIWPLNVQYFAFYFVLLFRYIMLSIAVQRNMPLFSCDNRK